MSQPRLAIEARSLSKSYGHVEALRESTISAAGGEVVALLGDNGAGKSTLLKCLAGAIEPDAGEMWVNGESVRFSSPLDARETGIETVYQDLAMAPDLGAASNLFLGRELVKPGLLGRLGFLDKAKMREEAVSILEEAGARLPSSDALVGSLSGGQRQAVAFMRGAHWGTTALLLDEPTAALGVKQSARVLSMIKLVAARGVAVVLVSHNIPFVFDVADRIVVLRLGSVVVDATRGALSHEEVIAAMVGGESAEESDQGRASR